MATNDFIEEGLTDDYDIYGSEGEPSALPGSPNVDASGHLVIPPTGDEIYFSPSTLNPSRMDPDPNNTGPTTDFWTAFPITIDINGYLYYYGENTGINIRGPQGMSTVTFDSLTAAQKAQITGPAGANGQNGVNGINGTDGKDGLSAYELWLQENGWLDDPEDHPIEDFYAYLADLENALIKEGTGIGSILVNNKGLYNLAGGASAFASGYYTKANGNYSASFGDHTTAGYANQVVFGKYNQNKSSSIFEIGYGDSTTPRNIFEISSLGNLTAAGNITDGSGNILSNKVNKVQGKGLSTNDFTDNYKTWIDTFTVDTILRGDSNNPISNSAVTNAINQIVSLNGKSALEQGITNADYTLGTVLNTSAAVLNTLYWVSDLKWNPSKKIFKNNNISTGNYTNIVSFGSSGLAAAANDQIILGKYNNPNANDYLQIGNGVSGDLANIFTISKTGNVTAAGDITDGSGNILSGKQNILQYDTIPTQNSTKVITSGSWYTFLMSIGINPTAGTITIPAITQLQSALSALTLRVSALETAVAAIGDPRRIIDDTYPANVYTYGVNQDQFYIQQIDSEEEEEEESEE